MFCENCGAKLLPDSKFCENCGYAVEPLLSTGGEALFDVWHLFATSDWNIKWHQIAAVTSDTLGIILTNTKNCANLESFHSVLDEYMQFKAKHGVAYYVLDMAEQLVTDCRGSSVTEDVIDVLKRVYSCARPEYLMIVGDKDVIGSTRWRFRTRNEYEYVDSDLPYITLDTQSPWKGMVYHFDECARVARVPAQAKSGLEEACTYFRNVMRCKTSSNKEIRGFSLSAKEWDGVSRNIHKSNIEQGVYSCSPPKEHRDFSRELPRVNGKTANLLYFNLHGSNETEYWYGQDGKIKPEAFSATCLKESKDGYMLGTEACYGAKPIFRRKPTMLTHALQSGCLAFLGSSQIAYGEVNRGAVCADVVVGEYIKHLAKGATAGDAFLTGMKRVADSPRRSDTEILTMAEFFLYGDPSCVLLEQESGSKAMGAVHKSGYYVPMPDVRRAVELKLAEISAEMKQRMQSYVKENYEQFADYDPQYYEVSGYGGYQAVYERQSEHGVSVLKVYFGADGNVNQVCMSK